VTKCPQDPTLEHVRSCAACRRGFVGDDPSKLFALLALRPIPGKTLERVSSGVTAALDGAERGPGEGRRMVAGLAAAIVLAALLGGALRGPLSPGSEGETAGERSHVAVLSPAGAAPVVDLTVGDTQVVMIFDERLEI
jgi:hypothetical protein